VKIQTVRERLLASTMIGGVALAALAAAPAHAQDASGASATVKEVVVTGSRIRQPNLTATSPVTTVNAQEAKFEGTQRTEDLVNNLPQVFADQGSSVSNAATGTATVNLRGLGSNRTLVLIDGRRLVPGDPAVPVPDLNMIPAAMIERVDVLTGGASATYGADAVAGVVNFILKKNFEGVQIDVNHSLVEHDNGNSMMQGLLNAKHASNPGQFINPPSNYWGGHSTDINITLGASTPDGKGNITAYMGYRQTEPVLESHYDYSACALGHKGAGVQCGGSGTTAPAQILANNGNGADLKLDPTTGALRPYNSATDAFNYGPYNYFQRNDTRYTGGYSAHYQVNKMLDVYGQFMFMDDQTTAQIAPSGVFGLQVNLACNNPMLTAQEVSQLCHPGDANYNAAGANGAGSELTYLYRRNVEGGPRQDNLHHTSFRQVIGARGDLNDTWSYDVYGQYGQTDYAENYQNDMSSAREAEALNVVSNNGVLQCANAAAVAQGCVPYNIFQNGAVTKDALSYLETPGFKSAITTEQVVSGALTGKLGNYGVKSPWANDGVSVAIGGEYRRETLDYRVDAEFQTGDLAGQGGATQSVSGAYSVKELFLEARVPLISDKPFVEDLSLDGGYRRSDYTSIGSTDTYKIEANWTPVHDIRFRAGFNRAVRAPNILELYSPRGVGLDGNTDPCAGAISPTSVQGQECLANDPYLKNNPGKLGNINPNSAGQYNGLLGGNPNLAPEKADTFTVGTVITPRFIPGFNLTIDYFDIKVHNIISKIGADTILQQCYTSGNPTFCNLINRAPNGSLWIGNGGYVVDTVMNTGLLATQGLDFQANYRFGLDKVGLEHLGHVDINFVGTETTQFHVEPLPGTSEGGYDCVGKFGPACSNYGVIHPAWRHKMRVTWTTPWKWDISGQWRFIGSEKFEDGTKNYIDSSVPAYNYFDLTADWKVKDNVTLRAGVNNLFDKDPPLVPVGDAPTAFNNGNTLNGPYDTLGRYIFMGLTANF
jgi:outer membrane receptor protein involved in Fe transport